MRRKHLSERYAILWLLAGLTLFVLVAWKGLLTSLSHDVGISYPPSALFAVAIGLIAMILLHFSLAVSRLSDPRTRSWLSASPCCNSASRRPQERLEAARGSPLPTTSRGRLATLTNPPSRRRPPWPRRALQAAAEWLARPGSDALAVVVVTHQSAEHACPTLARRLAGQLRDDDELVIVDNASTDGTPDDSPLAAASV